MGKKKNNNNTSPKVTKAKTSSVAKKPRTSQSSSGGETAAMRIMKAIASQMAMGKGDKVDRALVQTLALMPSKKSFDTTLLNMKKQDLVMYDKPTVWLTERGLETVGPEAIQVPTSNDAMLAKLKEQIKGKKPREIYGILTDGNAYSRAELAAKMKMEDNKSFGTYVSSLSKIVERQGNQIRLPDIAFPCGRPCENKA
eukprot:scaffold16355_cov170-Amphora_coffeaeformis.AAC.5